ncbi:MAG: SPFH domain-containing protein [Candidatus Acidiferrum sp.]|jgi:regulator of protease activity HflC (stomatin/prohibitin superfamily)
MLALKYWLILVGTMLFASAGVLVAYDIYLSEHLRRLLAGNKPEGAEPGAVTRRATRPVRWRLSVQLLGGGALALLLAQTFIVIPDGAAGVRVSELWGVRPGTLYPGLHLITPLIDSVALYDTREQVYATTAAESSKPSDAGKRVDAANPPENGGRGTDVLTVQAREGLNIGLAVSVRYRLDPKNLDAIHRNLPQPVGEQVVAPIVSTIYRQLAPDYLTREIFATKREELRKKAAEAITARLASDGILVREVLLRDLQLPTEYAKGLEGLLLKEQENERLGTEQEIKQKEVKIAELEGEAQKARDVKAAESAAQVHVLEAKAESDAMQYTLPLKQKQIEQSKLEAQARKEATLENADAAAQAKVIDSKAEVERQKNLSDAEANHIRVTAAADSERMKYEASVLKSNPMLIQKIIAERLSDKLQIMMVPIDGKNFFANDVMRSAFSGVAAGKDKSDSSDDDTNDPAPAPTAATVTAQHKPQRHP